MNTTFENHILTWSQQPRGEKESYYDQYIWPEVQRIFQQSYAAEQRYDILICPVSNVYTAILHIQHYRPDVVFFLYTAQSLNNQHVLQQLAGELGIRYEARTNIDALSPLSVYHAVKMIYERYQGRRIAVDVTGGTKAMSVGVAMAGSLIGADSVYIESRFDAGIQERRPGSERPERLQDPYTVFGDLEAREAQKLYQAHDYQGAQRMFDALAHRVPGQDALRFRIYAALSEAYAAWDSFDLPGAERMLDILLATGPADVSEAMRQHLIAQAESLRTINAIGRHLHGRSGPPLAALEDSSFILALFGSLYANAMRREEQGRLDVAALLLYRCLELMSQQRLAGYGIITEQVDMHTLRRRYPELEQHYRAVESRIGFTPRGLPRSDGITLFNGYMLLSAFSDGLTDGLDLRTLQMQVRVRNTSILAHGYRLITPTEYLPFKQLVDDIRQRFFRLLQLDIYHWEEQYRFVML